MLIVSKGCPPAENSKREGTCKGVMSMSKEKSKWSPKLEKGETLLWQGQPAGVGIIDPDNKVLVYIDLAVAALWIVLSLALFVPTILADPPILIVIKTVIMDIIPIILIFLPLRDSFELKNSVYYVITDHRIMVKTKQFQYSMLYYSDTAVEKRSNGTVCVGTAAGIKPGKERNIALSRGVLDDNGTCTGVVLYQAAGANEDMAFLFKG